MIEHIATVRDRAITWDKREVVQHGLNSDTIRVDADGEFASCDTLALILCSASRPEPMRYMVDETLTVSIPSALMEQTGALSVCLIGYVGGAVRIVTKQERMPLVVVKSGETGGIDPDDGNPDLWGQLLAAEAARVEAEHGREAAENLRVEAENLRVSRENERQNAETARSIAEAARVEAERGREAAENKRQQDTSTAIGNANKATSAANGAAETAEQKGIAAQEIADNIKAAAERGDFNGVPGAPGDKGDPGTPGRDGTSPTANVQQTAEGATVSITDVNGTTTATIRNGAKGDPGNDGTSPTASVKQTDTGATITVTDAHGTTTAEIANGRDGAPGEVADNSVTNVKLADNAVNTRTIANGAVTAGKIGGGAVSADNIAGGAVTTKKIANNAVSSTHLKDNAIRNKMEMKGIYLSKAPDGVSGTVHYWVTPIFVIIYPNTKVTIKVPELTGIMYVPFAVLSTGYDLPVINRQLRIAKIVNEFDAHIAASYSTDGTVTLSVLLGAEHSNKTLNISPNAFNQMIVPLFGGGEGLS